MTKPRLVILESPFAGEVEANIAYARAALRDSLMRGEAPLASHLLYTQPGVLDDDKPDERTLGIDAGLAWGPWAEATVVYVDRGISRGMRYGIERAERDGRPVEYRAIYAAPCELRFEYRNWRGRTEARRVWPLRWWVGVTEWHPDRQWLLDAIDLDRNEFRSFAVSGMVKLPLEAAE